MAENTNPQTGTAFNDLANLDEATGYISPTLERSRTLAAQLMARRPSNVSDLATLAKTREKAYADILGIGNKDLAQLGFLTSLANRGFAYAANVDPATGQPLRGSALSRFAGAARGLPEDLMKMAAAQRKEDQAIKLAAMQSAEKTIAAEREANQKLMEEQYKFAREDIKAAGKAGKITGTSFNQYQELITPFMEGTLNRPGQVRLINAVTDYVQPVTRTYTNKLGNLVTETTRNAIPKSFADAYKRNYGEEAFNAWWKSIDPKQELKISPISLPETAVGAPTPVSGGQKAEVSPVTPSVPVAVEIPAAPKTREGAQALVSSASRPPGDSGKQKLWDVRGYLAGPLNTLEAWWASNVPGQSPNVIDKSRKDALKANEAFIRALATNNEGKLSVDEMETNRNLIGLSPRIFGSEGSMSTALVSLDDAVALKRKEYEAIVNNPDKYLGSAISDANRKIAMIDEYKASLGVPPSIYNNDQLKNIRAGDQFVDKRSRDSFSIRRKDTFSYRDRNAAEEFRRKNPGKEYGIVEPSGAIKIYRAPR